MMDLPARYARAVRPSSCVVRSESEVSVTRDMAGFVMLLLFI